MKREQVQYMLETGDHATVDNPFNIEHELKPKSAVRRFAILYVFLLLAFVLAMRLVDRHHASEHTCDDPACTSNVVTNNNTGTDND